MDKHFCPACDSGGCAACDWKGTIDGPLPLAKVPAFFYHEHPKVGVCDHEWSECPPDWDRSQDYMPNCTKCGMSLMAHAFMEMP